MARAHVKLPKMFQIRILLLLVAAALFLTSCKSDYQASARQGRGGDNRAPRKVKTVAVAETPFGETVTANGTLAAYDQTTVSVKVPGRVRVINVDLGSVVSRGQLIAHVDSEDYRLRVQQAEASLAQARARLGLAPDGTNDRVDPEQTATVRQARAVLDEARHSRDRAARLVEQGVIAKAEFDTATASIQSCGRQVSGRLRRDSKSTGAACATKIGVGVSTSAIKGYCGSCSVGRDCSRETYECWRIPCGRCAGCQHRKDGSVTTAG